MDVRVTLVSPMGTRSLLQAINGDTSRGPADWTYWSTQHFYESSAGEWRVEISDERNTTVRSGGGSVAATGNVTYVELIVQGVRIADTDKDGLDDAWEEQWFGDLRYRAADDPDQDGSNNAREQVMGTNPAVNEVPFQVEFEELKPGFWRFSWPGLETGRDTLQRAENVAAPFVDLKSAPAQFPVTEAVIPSAKEPSAFYRVRRE